MHFSRRELLALLGTAACRAAEIDRWRQIASQIDGTVGAAALHLRTGKRLAMNSGDHFPLASVCKLPLAAHILALVDEGRFAINEEIEIPRYDVWPGVSVVAERWDKQHHFRLNDLLEWMVARSDNTAVQTLFRIGGGSKAMAARFQQWKVTGMRLDRSERQCGFDAAGVRNVPPVAQWVPGMDDKLIAAVPAAERLSAMRLWIDDPRDTATPDSAVQLLQKLYAGELISGKLTARLIEILNATTTGPARIKGLLPAGTVVGHKTGTGWSAGKLNGATNDAGVIQLPGNAGQIAIAVFIKGSTADTAARERVIAEIAKSAYDSWSKA